MNAADPDAVRVTTALAEAGLLFALGRGPRDRPAWNLRFQAEPSLRATSISLSVEDKYVQVVAPVEEAYSENRATELLRLNARLVYARVAIAPDGHPVVATQVPVELVCRATLSEHLGAVQLGVDLARKVLAGAAVEDVLPGGRRGSSDAVAARKRKKRRLPAPER